MKSTGTQSDLTFANPFGFLQKKKRLSKGRENKEGSFLTDRSKT